MAGDDKRQRPVFDSKHYHFYSTGNMKVTRDWLCLSPSLQKPYCETCWLFADHNSSNPQWQWINGVYRSSQHLKSKIIVHEKSNIHIKAAAVYQRWKQGATVDT